MDINSNSIVPATTKTPDSAKENLETAKATLDQLIRDNPQSEASVKIGDYGANRVEISVSPEKPEKVYQYKSSTKPVELVALTGIAALALSGAVAIALDTYLRLKRHKEEALKKTP